jgi:catenin alpha
LESIRSFGRNASELIAQAAKRQQELKDGQLRDDLAAARAVLKKHSTMLLTASKVIKSWKKATHVLNTFFASGLRSPS